MRMRTLLGTLGCCLGSFALPSLVYAPPLPTLPASQEDVLVVDLNGDGVANQGDTIRQQIQIRNTLGVDALNATLREFLDPNTTLVPGSIRTSPVARDDTFSVPTGEQLVVHAPGLLDNDGDADGDAPLVVTPNPVSNQGVPVAVEKDGGFVYTAPSGFTGVDSFFYRIEDDDGMGNDAEVQVTVIPAADLTLTKIDDPDPVLPGGDMVYLVEVVNLGPHDAVDAVLADIFPAGSVFVDASWPIDTLTASSVTFRLGDLEPGAEVTVKIQIQAPEVSGTIENLAIVGSAVLDLNPLNNTVRETTLVNAPPDAAGDTYASLGNVGIGVPAFQGVLANDTDPEGTALTVASFDAFSTGGGEVEMAVDGSFQYLPAPGFEGLDRFGYTASDVRGATASAVVTVTVDEVVWFVDNTAAPGGDGRLHAPFSALTEVSMAADPDDPSDTIFVATGIGPYPDLIELESDQVLVGQGADLAATAGLIPPPFSFPLPGSGAPPTLGGGPVAVLLAQGNTLAGLDVVTTASAGIVGVNADGLVVSGVDVETTGGPGLTLDGGNGVAIDIGRMIVRNDNGMGVFLANLTGTTRLGVMDIENDLGTGFTAENAGTVEIAAALVQTRYAPALEVLHTTGLHLGQPGWVFDSVTSFGSPRDSVTFTDVSQDITLRNLMIVEPARDGLAFTDIGAGVSLVGGIIEGLPHGRHGVHLNQVTGSVLIQGTHAGSPLVIADIGTGDPDSDCGVLHVNSGDLTMQFVDIRNVGQTGDEHGIRVLDPLPGLRTVRILNCLVAEIGDTDAVGSGSAIDLEVTAAHGFTGVLDLDIASNTLRGDGTAFNTTATGVNVDFSAGANGTLHADVNDNDLDGVREGIAFLVKGNAGTGGNGRNVIRIESNSLDDLDNNGIEIDITDDATGVPAASNTRALILNNTLRAVTHYDGVAGIDPDTAIEVEMRGAGAPTLSVDITGNTISSGSASLPWSGEGILVGTAALDPFTGTGSFDIENNVIGNVRSEGIVVRSDELASVNVRVINNAVVAGGDGLEVDVTNDGLTQNLLISGNDFSTTSASTSDHAYDIETDTDPTQNIECAAGCPVGTGATQGVANLVSVLNHNGDTVGGSAVSATDVDNPGGVSFNIVAAGSTSAAN